MKEPNCQGNLSHPCGRVTLGAKDKTETDPIKIPDRKGLDNPDLALKVLPGEFMKRSIIVLMLVAGLLSCNGKEPAQTNLNVGQGLVKEAMNVAGYTYALIEQDGKETWVAGPEANIKPGDRIDLPEGAMIQDFHSKTLDRTFDSILFAPRWKGVDSAFPDAHPVSKPAGAPAQGLPAGHPPIGQ